MQLWLFEAPWWLIGVFAFAGIASLLSGNARQNARLKLAGAGFLLAGGLLWLTSFLVETPREIALRQTREAITAVLARDRGTLDRLLHPRVVLLAWGKDQVLDGAIEYHDRYGLLSAKVTGIEGVPSDSFVTVTVSVLSSHDPKQTMVSTIPSTWELKWMDTAQGWQLKEIAPIRIGTFDRSQLPAGLFGR